MKETGSLFHLGEKLSNTAPPDMHLFLYFMRFKSCCCNPSTLNTNPLRFSFFFPLRLGIWILGWGVDSQDMRAHIFWYIDSYFFITPSAGILALSNVRILRQAVERFLIACRRLELSDVIEVARGTYYRLIILDILHYSIWQLEMCLWYVTNRHPKPRAWKGLL